MMLIKIYEDVFDITTRLKEIDKDYFVVFNTQKNKYEVHNKSQKNTYCLSVPFSGLDSRTIDLTLKTRRENIDKLLKEIEQNNETIEKDAGRKTKDLCEFKAKEFFDYSKKHEEPNFYDAYTTRWA